MYSKIPPPPDVFLRRMQMCKFWRIGKCLKGSLCPFLHFSNEPKICPYYQYGFCSKGKLCDKSHYQRKGKREIINKRNLNEPLPDWYLDWAMDYIGINNPKYIGVDESVFQTLYENISMKSSFYLMKVEDLSLIKLSIEHEIWSSSNENMMKLVTSFLNSDNLFIIFYSDEEKTLLGYGVMSSLPVNTKNSIIKQFLKEGIDYHFGIHWIKQENTNKSDLRKLLNTNTLIEFAEMTPEIGRKLIKMIDPIEECESEKETASVLSFPKEFTKTKTSKQKRDEKYKKRSHKHSHHRYHHPKEDNMDYWKEFHSLSKANMLSLESAK